MIFLLVVAQFHSRGSRGRVAAVKNLSRAGKERIEDNVIETSKLAALLGLVSYFVSHCKLLHTVQSRYNLSH